MLNTNSLLSIVEKMYNLSKNGTDLEELEKLYTAFIMEYSIVEIAIDVDMEKLGNIK